MGHKIEIEEQIEDDNVKPNGCPLGYRQLWISYSKLFNETKRLTRCVRPVGRDKMEDGVCLMKRIVVRRSGGPEAS